MEVGIGQSFEEHGANVFAIPLSTIRNVQGHVLDFVFINHFVSPVKLV